MHRAGDSTDSTGLSVRKWGNKPSSEEAPPQFPGLLGPLTVEYLGFLVYKMRLIFSPLFMRHRNTHTNIDRTNNQNHV